MPPAAGGHLSTGLPVTGGYGYPYSPRFLANLCISITPSCRGWLVDLLALLGHEKTASMGGFLVLV